MKAKVYSIDLYTSLPVSILDTDGMKGSVIIKNCDIIYNEPDCEAIEIEIKAKKADIDYSFFATLTRDDALFVANSIINIIKIQKNKKYVD